MEDMVMNMLVVVDLFFVVDFHLPGKESGLGKFWRNDGEGKQT